MTPSWTEPCAIIDSYMLAHQLWEVTGNSDYLNDSQMILYNGLYRGQRTNGGFGCDSTGEYGFLEVRKETYEAKWCCTMRGAEGLTYLSKTAVYIDEKRITIPIFSDLSVHFPDLEILEKSSYPKNGYVKIRIEKGDGKVKDLCLFAPERCDGFQVKVDGKITRFSRENGFVVFNVVLNSGTESEYTFEQKLHLEQAKNNIYDNTHQFMIVYGTRVLGSEHDGEKIDIKKMVRLGDEEWQEGDRVFKPISNGYLMEKVDLINTRYRVMYQV